MSLLHIVFAGPPEQKQSIKVTAMQSIAAALPEACAKFKPALDPASVKLSMNKKQVDIACPFRLANIPAGSILHVSTYKPIAAPTANAPAASTAASAPAASTTQQRPTASSTALPSTPGSSNIATPAAGAAPGLPSPPPAQTLPVQPVAASNSPVSSALNLTVPALPAAATSTQHPQVLPQGGASAVLAAPVTAHTEASTPTVPTENDTAAAPAATAATATTLSQSPVPASATVASPPDVDLLQVCAAVGLAPAREAILTTEAALQAHAAAEEAAAGGGGSMDVDDNDAFYELTPEDLMEVSRAAEARRKEEAAFKTQAMREAEERAKMEAYGHVPVRLRFTDGLVIQAAFRAAEQLQAVKDFLAALLVNPAAQMTLFITPPKQILKDMSITLYKAGLIPAAVVHCQVQGAAGSSLQLLKPELHPLLRTDLPAGYPLPGQQAHAATDLGPGRTQAARQAAGTGSSSNAASRALDLARQALGGGGEGTGGAGQAAGRVGGQGKGLPKWFKR